MEEDDHHSDTADSVEEALALDEVEELEYTGRIGGFLSDKCTIYLRLYHDSTLDGHVRQRKKRQLHGLKLLTTSKKHKRMALETTTTNSNDATKKEHGHAHDSMDSMLLSAFIQGTWSRTDTGVAACDFHAMKRQGHIDRHTLACHAELLTDDTANGTWTLSMVDRAIKQETKPVASNGKSGDDGENIVTIGNVFEWWRTGPSQSANEAAVVAPEDPLALYPLTAGTYHFRGFTTYALPDGTARRPPPVAKTTKSRKRKAAAVVAPPPKRDECVVTMELLSDGTLRGTSTEVAYPQRCVIRGSWEIGRVRYVLEYKVREATGLFKYSASVSTGHDQDDDKEDSKQQDHGNSLSARVLQGKWRNVDDGDHEALSTPGYAGGRGSFELTCVHAQRTAPPMKTESTAAEEEETKDDAVLLLDSMRVFTTGRFILQGKAMDDDGYEYASKLHLELFSDGSLTGTCQELVFQQTQQLHGHWAPTRIEYELAYVVKKEVGAYFYRGVLDSDGLVVHGKWCNMELLLLGDDDEMENDKAAAAAANYNGEKGHFSYAILESQRRWSRRSHKVFPKLFRDRVKCILLCSQRTHVLPSALWSKIFVFCGQDWFYPKAPSHAVDMIKKEQIVVTEK